MRKEGVIIVLFLTMFYCKEKELSEKSDNVVSYDTVGIAFYNVQNLFDLDYCGSEYKEYKPGVSNWDRIIMNKKLDNTASVLIALKAEVIGLCEIENRNALKKLQRTLENKGYALKYCAIADEPVKSNTCPALISKYPIRSSKGIPVTLKSGITRNILEADIEIGKKTLKIFVNHWPSKINPESWRVKSAEALSSRLKEISNGTDYILIGDFNSDYDDHRKITTSGTDDMHGFTGMHSLLKTICRNGSKIRYVNENDMTKEVKENHYDLWLELPERVRMSHFFKGNRQTPDHILIPSSLYDSSGISYVDNSFRVFTWDGQLISNKRPFRWQILDKKGVKLHTGRGYSDHLPIQATFTTSPFSFQSSNSNQQKEDAISDLGTDSFEIWSEGWMLCSSEAEIFTDITKSMNGKSSICIRGEAQKNNCCIAKLIVPGERIKSDSLSFNIMGSGRMCIRIRYSGGKWVYYDVKTMNVVKSARYQMFNQKGWKKITFKNGMGDRGNLEIEIRTGKGEPLCLWID